VPLSGGFFGPQLFGAYAKPFFIMLFVLLLHVFLVCMPTWLVEN
jgi:hypothetical protein